MYSVEVVEKCRAYSRIVLRRQGKGIDGGFGCPLIGARRKIENDNILIARIIGRPTPARDTEWNRYRYQNLLCRLDQHNRK